MQDARRFGLDEAAIAAVRAALAASEPGEDEGIWPEHAAIVEAFLAASTQWRVFAAGDPQRLVWTGLDYAGARAGIEAAGIRIDAELWAGLRIMEREAMRVLNGAQS